MKVFIYSKKTSKKLVQIDTAIQVRTIDDHKIQIYTEDDEVFTFDTSEVKTTIYQN